MLYAPLPSNPPPGYEGKPPQTPTATTVPTETPEPTYTDTPEPTATETATPEPTATETLLPTATEVQVLIDYLYLPIVYGGKNDTPIKTPTPTATATIAPTSTPEPTAQPFVEGPCGPDVIENWTDPTKSPVLQIPAGWDGLWVTTDAALFSALKANGEVVSTHQVPPTYRSLLIDLYAGKIVVSGIGFSGSSAMSSDNWLDLLTGNEETPHWYIWACAYKGVLPQWKIDALMQSQNPYQVVSVDNVPVFSLVSDVK
jgi:hypothetical protein